jgi:HAD superfamily hydrolase (TIGR01509 family)
MTVKLNEGRPVFEIAKAVFDDAGRDYTDTLLTSLIETKNALFRATNEASIYSQNFEIISTAKAKGLKVGLVTGTKRKNLSPIIPDHLLQQLDVVITEGDTERGKPSPDPYLAASDRLLITPQECLVVENAPAGIESAKSAGMFCVALKTTLPESFLDLADVIFDSHSDFQRKLAQLIAR